MINKCKNVSYHIYLHHMLNFIDKVDFGFKRFIFIWNHKVRLQLSLDVKWKLSQICFTIVVPLYIAPAMKWVPGGRIFM